MTTEPTADRWEPVRIGRYYGSPACCGARLCTVKAFDRATSEAAALIERLGPGWVSRVHENLGWFYEARLLSGEDVLAVHPVASGSAIAGDWTVSGYWASLNGRWSHSAPTPEGAVAGVVAAIRAEGDRINAVLAQAEGIDAAIARARGVGQNIDTKA